jgi:hypothetical protein
MTIKIEKSDFVIAGKMASPQPLPQEGGAKSLYSKLIPPSLQGEGG